jgi:hypothetical protein
MSHDTISYYSTPQTACLCASFVRNNDLLERFLCAEYLRLRQEDLLARMHQATQRGFFGFELLRTPLLQWPLYYTAIDPSRNVVVAFLFCLRENESLSRDIHLLYSSGVIFAILSCRRCKDWPASEYLRRNMIEAIPSISVEEIASRNLPLVQDMPFLVA